MNQQYYKIAELQPSIGTENLGDFIIQKYIDDLFNDIFKDQLFVKLPTRSLLSWKDCQALKQSKYRFICGTNLLSKNIGRRSFQWSVAPYYPRHINDLILLGVGWWQYEEKTCSPYVKWLLNSILSHHHLHSVRDSYTEKKLNNLGFSNVINTACPSMWGLTEEHCSSIPAKKAGSVVTTLTNYNESPAKDANFLNLLFQEYKNVYIWIQAVEDFDYLKTLGVLDKAKIIPPGLKAYEDILTYENIDYVGTRLHAGIHALNFQKRTLILAVDNRAIEISKDTNLPVVNREIDLNKLSKLIEETRYTEIKIPIDNINIWKSQFSN